MASLDHKVFLCFRGEDVRKGFLSFLVAELKRKSIGYYVDQEEMRGAITSIFLQTIEECKVVLVIFSEKFMDSKWCTSEVLKAMETRGPGKTIIPVFYKVTVEEVKQNWSVFLEGKMDKWSTITKVTDYLGLVYTDKATNESDFVDEVVKRVKETLTKLENNGRDQKKSSKGSYGKKQEISISTSPFFGIEQRVQQLHDKLRMDHYEETRVVGVVGMRGIGKTKIAEMLFEGVKCEFERPIFFKHKINRRMEKDKKLNLLLKLFLQRILKKTENVTITDKTTHEDVKEHLLGTKRLLVLDDLSGKEEIVHLLGDRGWIRQGSKIVIVTSDKSLVEGVVDDTYVVPGLNEEEGMKCLSHHAFGDAKRCGSEEGNLLTLSRKFVDYAWGNPLALTLLGKELWARDVGAWESILSTLENSPNKNIQDLLNSSYDGLTEPQQDAFLDIACFFRSLDRNFVKTMVDPSCAAGERSIIKDLSDKFLIEISGNRVEMNGLLYTLGKNLASLDQLRRLWNQQEIIKALSKKQVSAEGVRGIFLDISEAAKMRPLPLRNEAFLDMTKLRYLKIYDSYTYFLKTDSKVTLRNGLKFPLEDVRYLYWLKFPLEELPTDFIPKKLIDLTLPCSHIKRLWNGSKDVRKLKWVDLSHSINLHDLTGLSGAGNLQRLKLEGCTGLTILLEEIGQLYHLQYLDLKDCKNLTCIPTLPPNLQCLDAHGCDSLATVANPLAFLNLTDHIHSIFIFSNCNNLDEFAKSCIISYIQQKSQLMTRALNRYNLGSVVELYIGACFPGCEVPEWFSHQAYGSEIETELGRHWSGNRIIGVALCAAVSLRDYTEQNSGFLVKCTFDFKNAGVSFRRFSCTVGGSSGPGIEPRKIESDHVFVSYTNLLQIKKQSEAEDREVCRSTKVSLRFEVIDGAESVIKFKVLKCGFSMVYDLEGSDHDNMSPEVNFDGSQLVNGSIHDDQTMSSFTPEPDVMSTDEHMFHDDDDDDDDDEPKPYRHLKENGRSNLETKKDSHHDEVTPSTSPEAASASRETQPEATPGLQESRMTTLSGEDNQGISGEGEATCFSFIHCFIPCLGREEPKNNILEVSSEGDAAWFSFLDCFIPCLRRQQPQIRSQ